MADSPKPDLKLAKRVLPASLFRSLQFIFAQGLQKCVLAGGTSLAGFYAGHRRSEDIDLFTADESAQRAAVLAVRASASIGAELKTENNSAQYFEGLGKIGKEFFKITVVMDANLFRVGKAERLVGNVTVVDLETLFKMKAATLVSRASEKDLYDLIWLFRCFRDRTFPDLIALGSEIDGGVNGEAILSSVSGAILREEACDFSLNEAVSSGRIYRDILEFRKRLLKGIAVHLEAEPVPLLGELVHKLDRIAKKS